MFKLAILALLVTLTSASTQADWLAYKQKFNKVYTGDEDVIRRYIWESNLQQIQAHNELFAQGLSSFTEGENQFTDMTDEEFSKYLLPVTGVSKRMYADTVDRRTRGYIIPDQNQ